MGPRIPRLVLALAVLVAAVLPAAASERYDPRLRFRSPGGVNQAFHHMLSRRIAVKERTGHVE